jgi:hypothetical protein
LHHRRRIRHEAVEPDACRTVYGSDAEGWITMHWISSVDRYDLIIGAAIVFFVTIIAVVALT